MKNILMNVETTKAILDGRKSRFREAIKSEILDTDYLELKEKDGELFLKVTYSNSVFKEVKPQYQIGETIWVREPAKITRCDAILNQFYYQYLADGTNKWQEDIPNRFIVDDTDNVSLMYPKWIYSQQGIPNGCIKEMARIFLKITDVRVERLRDISTVDIYHEGLYPDSPNDCPCNYTDSPCNRCWNYSEDEDLKEQWINLWNKTAPKGYKWEDNPYVFVYELEKAEG